MGVSTVLFEPYETGPQMHLQWANTGRWALHRWQTRPGTVVEESVVNPDNLAVWVGTRTGRRRAFTKALRAVEQVNAQLHGAQLRVNIQGSVGCWSRFVHVVLLTPPTAFEQATWTLLPPPFGTLPFTSVAVEHHARGDLAESKVVLVRSKTQGLSTPIPVECVGRGLAAVMPGVTPGQSVHVDVDEVVPGLNGRLRARQLRLVHRLTAGLVELLNELDDEEHHEGA